LTIPPTIIASEFNGDLSEFLSQYSYQNDLTPKLDAIAEVAFTQELVNEIVLWKVNRFVRLSEDLLRKIDAVKGLAPGEHRNAEALIDSLLRVRGVDLPMATTLLRFRNPSVFQIIDGHAYRAVYRKKFPLHTPSPPQRKIRVYFDYVDELIELCGRKALKLRPSIEFCISSTRRKTAN
jgi:hypothetical protein